jgi:SPW repeat
VWAQIINAILGVWLMAAPAVLGYTGLASTQDRIIGPLAVSCAVIALWEVTRPMRWGNLALGAWLLVAPWVLAYGWTPTVNSSTVGVLLILFALVRGEVRQQRFGGGWSALWRRGGYPSI